MASQLPLSCLLIKFFVTLNPPVKNKDWCKKTGTPYWCILPKDSRLYSRLCIVPFQTPYGADGVTWNETQLMRGMLEAWVWRSSWVTLDDMSRALYLAPRGLATSPVIPAFLGHLYQLTKWVAKSLTNWGLPLITCPLASSSQYSLRVHELMNEPKELRYRNFFIQNFFGDKSLHHSPGWPWFCFCVIWEFQSRLSESHLDICDSVLKSGKQQLGGRGRQINLRPAWST